MNEYRVTHELLKSNGYHFCSKDDEKMFIKFLQNEFLRLVGVNVRILLGEERYKELECLVLNCNAIETRAFWEDNLPLCSDAVDAAWAEIKKQILWNRNNVSKILRAIPISEKQPALHP